MMRFQFIFGLLIYYFGSCRINGLESFDCCHDVLGPCRIACENIQLVNLAIADQPTKDPQVQNVRRSCPTSMTEFWTCMNQTLDAINYGKHWSGRPCCHLGYLPRCQTACATGSSRADVQRGCRQSDEQNLFSCLERQEVGEECCRNARTSDCMQGCRFVFRSKSTPSVEVTNAAIKLCNESSPIVSECIRNATNVMPANNLKEYLPCCDESKNDVCRKTCRRVVGTAKTSNEGLDELENGGCGHPHPFDPLWACFLATGNKKERPSNSKEVSRINQIGIDSAKLHCCGKAVAPKCRRLCKMTFSSDWTETKDEFELDCLSQVNEMNLRHCLEDVDEPCELGCDGLSFCTNFNNRPTELFRSCTNEADIAARSDVTLWQEQGILKLPGIDLPIRNISHCSPEIWKAIACTLQIKPCTRETHANQICREDCFNILSQCLDWTTMPKGQTASSICKKLSVDDATTACISLKPFLEPSDIIDSSDHISSPCRSSPCNSSEVCRVNRGRNDGHPKYVCKPACPLGEASSYHVAVGTYVRIPISSENKGCLKICRCGSSGRLEKCQPLPCISYDSCTMGGNKIEHGTWFNIECNVCSCFAGEITCTKKQCRIDGASSDKTYSSLPCNCPPHYMPDCGPNGMIYPSVCVAKCTGLQNADHELGSCRSHDPCRNHNCNSQSTCLPDYKVCLSNMHRPCAQYQCVNLTLASCGHGERVCDDRGKTHSSICHMMKSKSNFAYYGACRSGCSAVDNGGPVCGINGITYQSECEAFSDFSLIDYKGACGHFGLLTDIYGPHCSGVDCAPIPHDCHKIVPPGACCPICGAGIRIVYSRKQIDRALYALNDRDKKSVTLKSILRSLENLVQTAQCRLVGYLTVETDLFVSVQPIITTKYDKLLTEICSREAEKLATLIGTQSHRVTTELGLSALTVANLMAPSLLAAGSLFKPNILLFLVFIVLRQVVNS